MCSYDFNRFQKWNVPDLNRSSFDHSFEKKTNMKRCVLDSPSHSGPEHLQINEAVGVFYYNIAIKNFCIASQKPLNVFAHMVHSL